MLRWGNDISICSSVGSCFPSGSEHIKQVQMARATRGSKKNDQKFEQTSKRGAQHKSGKVRKADFAESNNDDEHVNKKSYVCFWGLAYTPLRVFVFFLTIAVDNGTNNWWYELICFILSH